MNLIDGLRGEHASLLTMFDHIERFAPSWDIAQIRSLASLLETVLLTHASLEDEYLFNAISANRTGISEALSAMGSEHRHINELLIDLQTAELSTSTARALLFHLVEAARDHFAVEERTLFSIAGEMLGEERLLELGTRWAARRHLSYAG